MDLINKTNNNCSIIRNYENRYNLRSMPPWASTDEKKRLTTRKISLGVDFLKYGPHNKSRRRIMYIGPRNYFSTPNPLIWAA